MNDEVARPTCFLARMRLDQAGTDRWRGRGAEQIPRGLLAAQAMVAAGVTTCTRWRWVHSVHVTHLAQGDTARDVEYRVERLNDTEHTTTRLVHAIQGATALPPRPSRSRRRVGGSGSRGGGREVRRRSVVPTGRKGEP